MQVKLDIEDSRVKGIVFHPSRPWILYSTHTGTIHLYDYDIGVELYCYNVTNENVPVRCVAFHPTQPLFACGTDNYDVIVYNYQRKMKLFTLTGHTDYIRSVEFHSVYPLLISSSDDSTARIWNWQSRCCVAVLEEHTYFVMCARFNPQKPLVATASLDDCVRVFNVSSLFNSSMSKDVDASFLSMDDPSVLTSELEEHPDGANCVAWDQSGNRLFSCGEDSQIKIYNIINDEAMLINTIHVHYSPVTAIAVHPATSNFVSVSEDSTLRVFDISTNQQIAKYEIPVSRFWCVACHPKDALIAAGHDRGFVLLKFAKERPPFDVQGNSVLWTQGDELHIVDVISKETEKPIVTHRHQDIKSLSWNSSRSLALVCYSDATKGEDVSEIVDVHLKNPITPIEGSMAVWLSRSSFVSLSHSKDKLLVKELSNVLAAGNSVPRQLSIPYTSRIFAGTQQRVYLATRTSIILFDVVRSTVISEINFMNAKSVTFDDSKENICVRSSSSILTAKADLTQHSIFNESSKIKSCCFNGSSVLYTTRSHLKYIVKNASGVVCSLPRVLYIIKAQNSTAWFITRDGILFKREIEMSEVKLKSALIQSHNEDVAKRIIKENPPIGQAIMEFAADNQRYDIAASLARDPKTKFEMSLKSSDFKTASEAADELNDPKYHKILASSLIEAGLFEKAEQSLKKAKDTESLAFLYLISGESEKLSKLSKQTKSLEHYIWSNDDSSISKFLEQALPNITFEEDETSNSPTMKIETGLPVLSDWPALNTTTSLFGEGSAANNLINIDDEEIAGWSDDDVLEAMKDEKDDIFNDDTNDKNGSDDENDGWKIDLDINEKEMLNAAKNENDFVPPTRGTSLWEKWSSYANTAGDLCASGHFSDALAFLQRTIALKNAEPLRDIFTEVYVSSNACIPTNFLNSYMITPLSVSLRNQPYPSTPSQVSIVEELTKSALSFFSRGKFTDCRSACLSIMYRIAVSTCNTHEEEQKLRESLETARNYCLGVNLELKRKSEAGNVSSSSEEDSVGRQIELATYLTYLKLIPSHIRLVLQSAMRVAAKGENYATCKPICQRLLDMAPPEKVAKQAQSMLAICNQKGSTNKHKIDFDERNPFVVCAMSMKPIYRGRTLLQCPFCGANYATQFKGQICSVCEMCEIGAQVPGPKLMRFGK
ncbi:hypothetical protein M9Y10_004418 [Tritrichomonas musculus]|uniref:Coatomer subunit alpha n=1 Tax=Tritrichomonas musculus TaxID=1915356 RepID=A0ABR2JT82_9EUKA